MAEGRAGLTSIVLPFHNQADHVESLVEGYIAALRKLPGEYEFLLVPNGSSDATAALCDSLSRREPQVRSISVDGTGWGRAVIAGLRAAEGDVLCYTNAARTSPETLALMLLHSVAYPRVVLKANRRLRDSLKRRVGGLLFNLECRLLFDLSTWDVNGTPKIFPREFSALLGLTRNDDLIDAEFVRLCKSEDYAMLEVPIQPTPRHGGRSTTTMRSAVRMYWGAWRMAREHGRAGSV